MTNKGKFYLPCVELDRDNSTKKESVNCEIKGNVCNKEGNTCQIGCTKKCVKNIAKNILDFLKYEKVIFENINDDNEFEYIVPSYLPLAKNKDKDGNDVFDNDYKIITCDMTDHPNFTIKFLWFIPFGLINLLICYFGNLPDVKRFWRDNVVFTFLNKFKVLIKLDFEKLAVSVFIKEYEKKLSELDEKKLKKLHEELSNLKSEKAEEEAKLDKYRKKLDEYPDIEEIEKELQLLNQDTTAILIKDKKEKQIKQDNLQNQLNEIKGKLYFDKENIKNEITALINKENEISDKEKEIKEFNQLSLKEIEQFIFYKILELYWSLDTSFLRLKRENDKSLDEYYKRIRNGIREYLSDIKCNIEKSFAPSPNPPEDEHEKEKWQKQQDDIKKRKEFLQKCSVFVDIDYEINESKNLEKTDLTIKEQKQFIFLNLFPDDMYLSVDNKWFVDYSELKKLDSNKTNIKCFKFNTEKNTEKNQFDFENPEYKTTSNFKNYTFNPNLTAKPKIFISYSHVDTEYRNEFVKHLKSLKDEGILDFYTDHIRVGRDWDAEMKGELKTSNIVCYLISSDFMSSWYIKNVEANINDVKNKTVVPIVIRECDYEHWNSQLLYKVQGANHNKILTLHDNYTYPYDKKDRSKNERDAFWTNIIKQLKELPEIKLAIENKKSRANETEQ